MSYMSRKNPAVRIQNTFSAHSVCVLNHLMNAEMVTATLYGTVGVIQDNNIKPHLVLAESLPSVFEQRRSVRTVEDSAAVGLNRVQHRSHPGCVVGRKGHHRIPANHKGLQGLDLVQLEVKTLLCFRRQETVTRKVSLKGLCGPLQRLTRCIKLQHWSVSHAVSRAAREEMGQIQMGAGDGGSGWRGDMAFPCAC